MAVIEVAAARSINPAAGETVANYPFLDDRGVANAGQVCISAKRIIVERRVVEEFTAKLTDRIRSLKVGDPTDPATGVGPMAKERSSIGAHTNEPAASATKAATELENAK